MLNLRKVLGILTDTADTDVVIVQLIKGMQLVQFSFYFSEVVTCSHRLPIFLYEINSLNIFICMIEGARWLSTVLTKHLLILVTKPF